MTNSHGQEVLGEEHLLDNAVWWALCTRHHLLAEARGGARRYQQDVSVFAAVEAFNDASWRDLAQLVGPSHLCAFSRRHLPTDYPAGWTEVARGRGHQMVLREERMDEVEPIALRRLSEDDVPQMLELVAATNPGPSRSGTIEMGHYFGHFGEGRLLAMAGERVRVEGYTETSAVCTHPEARRRGLGSAMTSHVAGQIFERGEVPFLHVAESNVTAHRAYVRLGFTERTLMEFALLRTPGP